MKEREEDDDAIIIADLLRVGIHIDGSKHIEEVARIGRLAHNKARSMRLRIKSILGKQDILRRAKELKDSLSYRKVYITLDLTRKQQEIDKQHRPKVKEFRDVGIHKR